MSDYTINIEGVDEVRRYLGRSFNPAIQAMTLGVGEHVRDEIATYPGPVKKPIEWASERQRRYYFAMRNAAVKTYGMDFEYTRLSDHFSQRLRDSWTTDQLGLHDAVVTSRATYAYWVQSAEGQQPFHRNTGWITDVEAVDNVESSGAVEQVISDVLSAWLNG